MSEIKSKSNLTLSLQNVFLENLKYLNANYEQQFLLAVSGGVDSMVLVHLFKRLNLKFSVAHCNFQLRGKESDEDEIFIDHFCTKNNIQFFAKRFDVELYKYENRASTQMAARELRYGWFKILKQKHSFDWIVTAHHLDDQIETFMINLSRGVSLRTFPTNENQILRPLYNLTKQQILAFAKEHQIQWREDSSNETDDYLRNKIRHHIVPELKAMHANFEKNFNTITNRLQDDQQLIESYIKQLKQSIFVENEDGLISLEINRLKGLKPVHTHIYYLFNGFGFIHPNEILKLMDGLSGSEIQSDQYRMIKNREFLLLQKRFHSNQNEHKISTIGIVKTPICLELTSSKFKEQETALDFDLIQFPLKLRKRKEGDVFFPEKMAGRKKISKYFKDEKFSKFEKENIWILCNADDTIIWIVGKRFDRRFIATNKTTQFLNINLC